MGIRNILEKIANEYLVEKNKTFTQNKLANFIRNESKGKIEFIINDSNYMVTGSPGKGQWSEVPWIAIFDKDITTTATKGYYIVYLFSADMKTVYLSLNQGWTELKQKINLNENAIYINRSFRKKLKKYNDKFLLENINLESNKALPKGYEIAHIIGKEYKTKNLPTEEVLIQDLKDLIKLYRKLKQIIIDESYIEYNYNIIAEEKESYDIDDNLIIEQEGKGTSLNCIDLYDFGKEKNTKSVTKKTRTFKTNYTVKSENQEKLGKLGESFVLEELRKKYGKESVEYIAKEDDSAGYDIKVIEENGNELYIEVKATKKGLNTPFYISKNEYDFAIQNKEKYKLYRVYNIKNNEADYVVINGNDLENLIKEVENYIVLGYKK